MLPSIESLIPQRAPFKFVDEIVDFSDNKIITKSLLKNSYDFYQGHFPGNPVTPGVILCEAAFQTGAALMALLGEKTLGNQTAVVTRIQNAKFKNISGPGAEIIIEVSLVEKLANAAFMKGKITSEGKTLLTIEFSAAHI